MRVISQDKIREIRELRGMSQTDVDKRAGLYVSALSQIEAGHYKPKEETLAKIAKALDVELSEIYVHDGKANRVEMLRMELEVVKERLDVICKVIDSMDRFFDKIDDRMLSDDNDIEEMAERSLKQVVSLLKG